MLLRVSTLLLFAALIAPLSRTRADVPAPPPAPAQRDSVATRWEEGAELTRLLGGFRFDHDDLLLPWRAYAQTNWVTGLTRGATTDGRVRHDARWKLALSRPLSKRFGAWLGVTGQHYDDRPRSVTGSFAQQKNFSHVVRGGIGGTAQWLTSLSSVHSIGPLQDSRDGYEDNGFGTWHSGAFHRENRRDLHDASASFDYEQPGSRTGLEGNLSYALQQQFEAASHNATVQSGWARRELISLPTLPSQLREEKLFRAMDEVGYEVAKHVTLRGTGDVRYSDTRLDDRRGSSSQLKELESGILADLAINAGAREATLTAGFRSVSQDVRGEILAGRTSDLGLHAADSLGATRAELRAAFSKYTLDTRSDENHDDRDELSWRFEGVTRTRVSSALVSEVGALVELNHLVYIFSENSANNRWSRLFLLTSRFVHRPNSSFTHTPEFRISANYQDYDFDTNPRQVRSTVFRKLTLGDSLVCRLCESWLATVECEVAREELGRLFWDEFEEERSDQTDVLNSSVELGYRFSTMNLAGLGVAYSSRQGDRFEQEKGRTQVQSLESWGPTARLELSAGGWFCRGSAQWVQQRELGRNDRQFVSGVLTAGRTW